MKETRTGRSYHQYCSVARALDLVDGTANLLRGIPLCGISLALIETNQPVLRLHALGRH